MRLSSFEAIVRAFNDANVPFLLVGGLAVNAHGYGRHTWDVDLVVQLQPAVIHAAFNAFGALGYRPRVPVTADGFSDPEERSRWIAEKGHRETPVDVFVTEPFEFDEEYRRAMVVEVAPGVQVRILRLETLLALKREAGRPQDLADIAELELLHGRRDEP